MAIDPLSKGVAIKIVNKFILERLEASYLAFPTGPSGNSILNSVTWRSMSVNSVEPSESGFSQS
jgi:hypothetical protein